jgi:transcriptional regulator with XRE-family HTH domain
VGVTRWLTGPSHRSGRRLREIRQWRGLSLRAVAELAGFSASYLSLIERGRRPVDRRSTLEALAAALRVAPSELGSAFPPAGRAEDGLTTARTFLTSIEEALTDIEIGEGDAAASWPSISRRLDDLAAARLRNDYTRQAELLPGLIAGLNGMVGGARREAALRALCAVYQRAAVTAKTLGVRGLPAFAALRARQAAEKLDDPAWHGLAALVTVSTSGRARSVVLADRAVDALAGRLDDPRSRRDGTSGRSRSPRGTRTTGRRSAVGWRRRKPPGTRRSQHSCAPSGSPLSGSAPTP